MLGPTPDWGSNFSAERDSGLEPPHESRPSHDPVELYSQTSSQEVCLQNYTVTVLAAELRRGCGGGGLTFSVFHSSSHFTTHPSRRKDVLPRRLPCTGDNLDKLRLKNTLLRW